jgi:Fic family protein
MIEDELSKIIKEYYEKIELGRHPFEQAVLFHHNFELIHPFTDGNGRVGRELFNFMLLRSGYPKMLFLGKDREHYIEALRDGDKRVCEEMMSKFVDLILVQREKILLENLQKVAKPPKKTGQLRLEDYF